MSPVKPVEKGVPPPVPEPVKKVEAVPDVTVEVGKINPANGVATV